MASAPAIQINRSLVEKLQTILQDSSYRETVENSASYNTRLALEKRLRLPFLDAQTGVAQNHCNLWMQPRHRMPGLIPGQIYTYPAKRWRKKRRSYLVTYVQTPKKKEGITVEPEFEAAVSTENANTAVALQVANEEVKETAPAPIQRDEGGASKEAWQYYDDLQPEGDEFDEPEPDSDFDYEESLSKRKKKKAPIVKTPSKPSTRGRKKQIPVNYDATDTEKPYSCETCGARYKTRPGLTYHYTHSHKNLLEDDDEDSGAATPTTGASNSGMSSASVTPLHPSMQMAGQGMMTPGHGSDSPAGSSRSRHTRQGHQQVSAGGQPQHDTPKRSNPAPQFNSPYNPIPPQQHQQHHYQQQQQQQQHHHQQQMQQQQHPMTGNSYSGPVVAPAVREMEQKARAQPSPYCDFCLGDATENKKSGQAEELVSCADCGRSGHPTCLQFTPNMIISVKQYRWQCIECKCCSLCGNSDNDEQLLFCDDCDRGYHMYCLKPPLSEPPEGSWSCHLCLVVFHRK